MKTVLVSGSNGFIATNFIANFFQKYNFIQLSHVKQEGHITLEQLSVDENLVNSIDVVINLAGVNIGSKSWSIARKNALLVSRVQTTLELVALFNQVGAKAHFISASAVGIYTPDQENNEDTLINYYEHDNFSQQLTRQWENTARVYRGKLTITRLGVVLGRNGGAFPKMLTPFLFYMGGPLGNGTQNFPWISLVDLMNALDYIIANAQVGIYNLVAPQIIDNNQLTRHIATIWHRPDIFRMPSILIKLIFGQMGQELFLNSLSVTPKRLLAEQFAYQYPTIDSCLTAIKARQF